MIVEFTDRFRARSKGSIPQVQTLTCDTHDPILLYQSPRLSHSPARPRAQDLMGEIEYLVNDKLVTEIDGRLTDRATVSSFF